ncbi:transporter substrate-binding domain-containing protein [Streptosporangium sp. NBC_01495]|uniref:transporter substrate-binding domain-containing protein n=1 Tax=Streptosporangium sp. NBC_01495 TaxID=2903899 RepID=UPI002E30F58E|nr:transporter substrate-binding domain-containing protein [Streptosporangium sp. NBC_01495]
MAKEPADGEKRPEGVSSPPETRGRSSREETGGPAGDAPGRRAGVERSRRTGGETGETGETPAGERRDRAVGERDRRPGDEPDRRDGDRYERDRRPDDRYERDRRDDDRHGQGRRPRGPYERDRWDDDRYERDRRSDERYDRDRWDDDRYDRDPRSEGADAGDAHSGPPIGPPGPSGPPRRRRFRRFRLAAWIALVLASVVVGVSIAWVGGPPTEAELREKAGLLNKDRLLVGVKEDTPGIALRKPGETGFAGFDIDIAYMIAADLGFRPDQVDFLSIETEDRARMQARDTDGTFVKVDLVVATFSVTPERKADPSVGFSTPYLYTEQSVVTRSDYPDDNVTSLGQLEGKRVCSLGTSTSLTELKKAIKVDPIAELLISKCVDRFADGLAANRAVDAVTTDAALLAGFVAEPGRKLRHHDIALEKTEMWAVNAGSNGALRTLVDLALYRSYADPANKMWEEAYEKHIRPLLAANPGVDVAQARQPCALSPDVRRWPWERTLPVQDCPSAP